MLRTLDRTAISELLRKNTVAQLKEIATNNGVSTTGVKQEIADRLTTHFSNLQQRKPSRHVLSFDMGYRNLAFCHLTDDATIVDWARIDLELPSFHPSVIAPIVRRFLTDRVTPSLNKVDTILVEQQRARSNGSHSVLEYTMRVNCVESILWCGLHEAAEKRQDITMKPVPRQIVDRAWQPQLDQIALENEQRFEKLTRKNYLKKIATSLLVQKWIETGTVVKCSDELKAMFEAEKKKDDLSDCLLQALTWFHWEKQSLEFIQQHLHA